MLAQDSHHLIRLLKASDPHESKLQIVRNVWHFPTFHVPSKPQLLVDWILSSLLSEASADVSLDTSFLLSIDAWQLLADILFAQDRAHTIPWLMPSLQQAALAPIIRSFLRLLPSVEANVSCDLTPVIHRCLTLIWPLSLPKMSADTLLDCFGVMLDTMNKIKPDTHLIQIGDIITSSFQLSLLNSANKKKQLCQTFMQNNFRDWVAVLTAERVLPATLVENIYAAGTELLYATQVLRQGSEQPSGQMLLTTMQQDETLLLSIFPLLPRLFSTFLYTLRKRKGELFAQSSSHLSSTDDMVCQATLSFYASYQIMIGSIPENDDAWSARAKMLSIIATENLYTSQMTSGDISRVFRTCAQSCVTALTRCFSSLSSSIPCSAIECMKILAEIDYAIISPSIPEVLQKVALVTHSSSTNDLYIACSDFLTHLLEYHSKSRSLPSYIESLLSITFDDASAVIKNGQECYSVALSCPIFSMDHTDRLSSSIHGFFTSGQVLSLTRTLLRYINDSWNSLLSEVDEDDIPRKKEKLHHKTFDKQEVCAISFSVCTRIVSLVFTSLPTHLITDESRRDLEATISQSVKEWSPTALLKESSSWVSHVASSALLRLRYSLMISDAFSLALPLDSELRNSLIELSSSPNMLPELRVESYRLLLYQDFNDRTTVIELLVKFLEEHFSSEASWSGFSHELSFQDDSNSKSALAMMHMLLDRYLLVIEASARTQQLDSIVQLLLSMGLKKPTMAIESNHLSAQVLLQRTLHFARFWELPRFRSSVLARLSQQTAVLEQADAMSEDTKVLLLALSTYTILPVFPMEYFSKNCRTEMCKRAVLADVLLSSHLDPFPSMNSIKLQTSIRIFLKRIFTFLGSVDFNLVAAAYFGGLLSSIPFVINDQQSYVSASMDLLNLYFSHLLRVNRDDEAAATLSTVLDSLRSHANFDYTKRNQIQFGEHGILSLVQLVTRDHNPSSFSPTLKQSMLKLRNMMHATLTVELSALLERPLDMASANVLEAWKHCLAFSRWLGVQNDGIASFGLKFVTKALTGTDDSQYRLRSPSFAILLEEFRSRSTDHPLERLEGILAAYISLRRRATGEESASMDSSLAIAINHLQVEKFSSLSDIIVEALKNMSGRDDELNQLLQVFDIMLHNSPAGTLRVVQKLIGHGLDAFINNDVFTMGSANLHSHVLALVSKHCSDSASSLRPNDVACILSLLGQSLTPSKTHDDHTSPAIFQAIISTLSALIRMRRDLMLPYLPHLGLLLQQLISSLRTVIPHLGRKQSKAAAETLPKWIDIRQPLSSTEAKSLSRLLEALTTKTAVRMNMATDTPQKAESLAKPFSKHVAYVLKAYVDAMNDVLCMLPSAIRKELQPGLFALCGMMSDHSRDALMITGLDVGGKTILKALWKDYEAQKYVGKG